MQLAGIRFRANQSKQVSIQCKLNCELIAISGCRGQMLKQTCRGKESPLESLNRKILPAAEELPALQLYQEKDCAMFAYFRMFFLQHPLLTRTRTVSWSWHTHFRPSIVILQPCVKVLILQLCVLQKMPLAFHYEGSTNRPRQSKHSKI